MQKVQITLPTQLLKELETERQIDGQDGSRPAFLRRLVKRAVLQMQEERWVAEAKLAFLEGPDPGEDPDAFIEWPGYGLDPSDERVVRVRHC